MCVAFEAIIFFQAFFKEMHVAFVALVFACCFNFFVSLFISLLFLSAPMLFVSVLIIYGHLLVSVWEVSDN